MKTRPPIPHTPAPPPGPPPPPPPAIRGLIRGVLLAALAAAALIAAPPAKAQTAGTFTFTSDIDRDSNTDGVQINEGDTVTLTLTANGLTSGEAQARIRVRGGTVDAGDLTSVTVGGILLPINSLPLESGGTRLEFGRDVVTLGVTTLTQQVQVVSLNDNAPEPDETFVVETYGARGIGSNTPFDTNASITITILESDGYGATTLAITVDDADTTEGDTAEFTVTLTAGVPAPTYPVTVDWAVSGDVDSSDHDASGGTLTFSAAGSQTINIAIAADLTAESAEDLTVTLSNPSAGATITTAEATTAIAANTLARRLTLTGPDTVAEGAEATYTVSLQGTPFANPTAITWTVTHGDTLDADLATTTDSIMFPTMTTFTIGIVDDDATAPDEPAETFTVTITAPDAASEVVGGGITTAISQDDDPAARAARVQTPLATFAKGATQLTAQAVSQRLRLNGGDAFNVNPTEFSLAHHGNGLNLWASGARINASGNDNGVSYDGDTAALHLGADTAWNDGLLGIAIAQSAGSANFTANDIGSTLKTSLIAVHPYFTRTVRNAKLWATAGVGAGEAELRETGNIKADTDLTLISAAAGATLAESPNASLRLGAQWSRAELDAAAFPTGQTLPKVTASALRLTGGAELSRQLGAWRPFLTITIRRDSGDGDDGNAADYGGGAEWQNNNIHLRLAGRKHAQGRGPDEEQLTLTARKTAGRLNLGLNLSAANGINTADLLTGELRF